MGGRQADPWLVGFRLWEERAESPSPWQGPVLDAALCNLGEPRAAATKEIRGVGPSLPSGARPPQSSFSWELPPCAPLPFFSSLLPRAPFPRPGKHLLPTPGVVAIYRNVCVRGQLGYPARKIDPPKSLRGLAPASREHPPIVPACVSMFYESYRFEHSRNCN